MLRSAPVGQAIDDSRRLTSEKPEVIGWKYLPYGVEQMDKDNHRQFCIGYRDGLFMAFVPTEGGIYSPTEVANRLDELLRKCKDNGLTHLVGLTEDAVVVIYEWLVKTKPAVEYVESLWQGESSASRAIGFRLPKQDD